MLSPAIPGSSVLAGAPLSTSGLSGCDSESLKKAVPGLRNAGQQQARTRAGIGASVSFFGVGGFRMRLGLLPR